MATKPTPAVDPKVVTIYGRLSFPQWTAQEAFDKSQKGKYPAKSVAEAKPNFNLLVEPRQLDKLRNHIIDNFFPHCAKSFAEDGEKGRDALEPKEIKDLQAQIEGTDFDGVFNTPIKNVTEKSLALAPECVASVKLIGNEGTDMTLQAVVRKEDELNAGDPNQLTWPCIRPLAETVHTMYPGCYVGVTVNLYAYHNGKLPGFSAGANVAVFRDNADRFGGGVAVDAEEMFAD
jgi:hypothetical protein